MNLELFKELFSNYPEYYTSFFQPRMMYYATKMSDGLREAFILDDIIGLEEQVHTDATGRNKGTIVLMKDGRKVFIKTDFDRVWSLWTKNGEEEKKEKLKKEDQEGHRSAGGWSGNPED
jgi:hypothetical protein